MAVISKAHVEKTKHLRIDVTDADSTSLHFNAGSKDTADAILAKLESSKALSAGPAEPVSSSPGPVDHDSVKPNRNGTSVHWAPPPEASPTDEQSDEADDVPETVAGDAAVVSYDFEADGDDELSVKAGDYLVVVDRQSSEEWWKCRNSDGTMGVVPASYIEVKYLDFRARSRALLTLRSLSLRRHSPHVTNPH